MTQPGKPNDRGRFRGWGGGEADAPRPWVIAVPAAILALVTVLVGLDVAGDARSGSSSRHVLLEVAIMAVALAGTVALWAQLFLARRRARTLQRDLARAVADADRFRAESLEARRGLSLAIDRQFDRWALTAAEREVALLLLKGLALKDVAAVRETSERTVRQQANNVYKKAGLAGRAELSAFFLEDLLAPPEAEPAAGGRAVQPSR